MNILFLNSLGKTKWGGGEKWMIIAGSGLQDRGHNVTIACVPGSVIEQKAIEKKLSVFDFIISADIAFWKIGPLKSFLKNNKIDVLVCCQNKDVKIGAKAARQMGIKAIFARQGIQNLSDKRKYRIPFTQYIDGIITNTLSIKRIYEDFEWIPENFVKVIYNGVSIPPKIQQIDLHTKYNLPKEGDTIFTSGRLDFQKGFDLLILVALMAKNHGYKWHFIIAGEGKLRDELTLTAEKKGISDRIHLIGFTNEIAAHLQAADIFVLPSRYEGMPNSLLEAMAIGKASVATNVNGAPELVEDGISGFLVESEDIAQLYAKIKLLLDDQKLAKSIGKNAKDRVQDNFTIEKMIDHLEQLFQKQITNSLYKVENNN